MAVSVQPPTLSEDRYHSELRKLLLPDVEAENKPVYKTILSEIVDGAKNDNPSPFTLDELLAVASKKILADLRDQYRHLKNTRTTKPPTTGTTTTPASDDADADSDADTMTRCAVCNRVLTAEHSVKAGIGPVCEKHAGPDAAPTDFGPKQDSGIPEDAAPTFFLNVHVASGEKKVAFCTLTELKDEVLPYFIRMRDDAQANITGIQTIIGAMEANGAERAIDVVNIVKEAL
jgi:hypothetical protein